MRFGKLKSKIENKLVESYKNNTTKTEILKFNSVVLKNKNISKLFYLYDELNSNKGLSESIANEFINKSISIYENTINKISNKDIKPITDWVYGSDYNNEYDVIDDLFSNGITKLEEKITSKKIILENITKIPKDKKEPINIPLNTMVNIANKTIKDYITNLNESDQKKLKTLLSSDTNKLKENYDSLKDKIISKLEKLQEDDNDEEVIKRIDETIEKINTESFDTLSYIKLQQLNENL